MMKALLLTLALLTSACSSELCGRVEGPELSLDAEGSTGCWAYTGDPRCYPTLADETPCDARREVFHWGDRLTLWCDADVVAPKAVMVPTACEGGK